MLKGNALRHQMVMPEQQDIYDYWRSQCKNGALPRRDQIDPQHIIEHLPTISFIEPLQEQGKRRFRYRLAGTAFWTLFNEEITGQYIDTLPMGCRCEYWDRVLTQVVVGRRPTAGVTRPGTPARAHLAQFWIRLPLSENGKDVSMILGFDKFVKLSDVPRQSTEPAQIYA